MFVIETREMRLVLLTLFALQAAFCEAWVFRGYRVGHEHEFCCESKLGQGSFGEVWLGSIEKTPNRVAIKFEKINAEKQLLPIEIRMYAALKNTYGIPNVHYSGSIDNFNVLVMDLVGDSFEKIQWYSKYKKFSHKSIALFAIQALERLEDVHARGIVHRDIKPENFAMDLTGRVVMLLDFGLSDFYIDQKTKMHVEPGDDVNGVGSPRYVSRTAFGLNRQGRRSDLESLGYVLKGYADDWFPWDDSLSMEELYKSKVNLDLNEFCEGLPSMYYKYLRYVRSLDFYSPPNYEYLKGLFRSYLSAENLPEDYIFDWTTEEQAKLPIPVKPRQQTQPIPPYNAAIIDNLVASPPHGTNVTTATTNKAKLPTASMGRASPHSPGWVNRPGSAFQYSRPISPHLRRPSSSPSVKRTRNSIQSTTGSPRKSFSKTFRSALCLTIRVLCR